MLQWIFTFAFGTTSFHGIMRAWATVPPLRSPAAQVPMFRTNIDNNPVGRFRGTMVVSMRPYKPAQVKGGFAFV